MSVTDRDITPETQDQVLDQVPRIRSGPLKRLANGALGGYQEHKAGALEVDAYRFSTGAREIHAALHPAGNPAEATVRAHACTTFVYAEAQVPGHGSVTTQVGLFLTPEQAATLGHQLIEAATEAARGNVTLAARVEAASYGEEA